MTSSNSIHHNEEKNDTGSSVIMDSNANKDDDGVVDCTTTSDDGHHDTAPVRKYGYHNHQAQVEKETEVVEVLNESHKVQAIQTWLHHHYDPTSIDTIVQPDYWPPRNKQMKNYYDWSLPTHEVYKYYDYNDESTNNDNANHVDDNHESDEKDEMIYNNHRHHHKFGTKVTPVTADIIQYICETNYSNDATTVNLKRNRVDNNNDEEGKEQQQQTLLFTPTFCVARSKLDYTYHTHVVKERQYLQDAIIQRIVSMTNLNAIATTQNDTTTTGTNNIVHTNKDQINPSPAVSHRPWIVFTAGPMGVGKGYVITQLQQLHLFNVRDHFITIDPDLIKYEIPEMVGYLQIDRNTAATKVHRESTQISDIIFEYAILHSLSVLVDGSLRDVNYYQSLFHRIRNEFPQYRIGIIHITATPDVIFERATSRAIRTGRVVPKQLLEESIEQVPKSVELLSPLADAVHVIANHPNQPIRLVSSTIRPKKRPTMKIGTVHNSDSIEDIEDDVITTTSWEEFTKSWDMPSKATTTPISVPDSRVNVVKVRESSKMDEIPEVIVSKEPTTSVILETTSTLETAQKNQTENPKSIHTSISMSQFVDHHPTHVVANAIWQKSYPNFCARCALVTDEQCGICIHNVHVCACSICSDHPYCSQQGGEVQSNQTLEGQRGDVQSNRTLEGSVNNVHSN